MKIGRNNFIRVCPSAILLSRRIHNKTHLSTVVNCRTVNNRHVDYRFYATTSDFFHRSLDLLHYTWYWRLHYRRPLQATQAEFYLLLANRSTAGVSAGGETRWLLRANPPAMRAYVVPATPANLAFRSSNVISSPTFL